MGHSRGVESLIQRIEQLERQLKQHDRRMNNFFREGKITSVDPETGTAIMDAGGIETPAAPWLTRAGAVRDWNPVSVGERAVFFSPTGDPSQGMILPGGFSSAYPQNSTDGAAPCRTIGRYSVTESDDGVVFKVGAARMEFNDRGLFVTVGGKTYQITDRGLNAATGGASFDFSDGGFTQTGGRQTHDGKNVGSDHRHGGVQSGSAATREPV